MCTIGYTFIIFFWKLTKLASLIYRFNREISCLGLHWRTTLCIMSQCYDLFVLLWLQFHTTCPSDLHPHSHKVPQGPTEQKLIFSCLQLPKTHFILTFSLLKLTICVVLYQQVMNLSWLDPLLSWTFDFTHGLWMCTLTTKSTSKYPWTTWRIIGILGSTYQ